MALKKTFENQDGGTSNGYYRVREVSTGYEKDKNEAMSLAASFTVELYDYDTGKRVTDEYKPSDEESETGRQNPKKRETRPTWVPEGVGVYSLTLADMEPVQNLIIKAYEHLKTLPEFNGATDC
jgi:hypothetical protein|tara:strand:+ start:1201 stop:1572 length:372 start_codon:yes stop_codon:yes gene_type:complete